MPFTSWKGWRWTASTQEPTPVWRWWGPVTAQQSRKVWSGGSREKGNMYSDWGGICNHFSSYYISCLFQKKWQDIFPVSILLLKPIVILPHLCTNTNVIEILVDCCSIFLCQWNKLISLMYFLHVIQKSNFSETNKPSVIWMYLNGSKGWIYTGGLRQSRSAEVLIYQQWRLHRLKPTLTIGGLSSSPSAKRGCCDAVATNQHRWSQQHLYWQRSYCSSLTQEP